VKSLRILVTGGLGFIGSNFIRKVLQEQDEVINIDVMSYGSNVNNLKNLGDAKYRFVRGDIADTTTIRLLLKEVDAIVNFAAETHVDRSIADPTPFFRTNVGGVVSILEAIRKSGKNIRFVHIGTDESYGDIVEGSFMEEDKLSPSSPYSASKASADLFVLAFQRTYGLNAIVTRCTNNFGPFQFPEKFVPKVIIRSSMNMKVPIYGAGKNVRDWIYVHDHCDAIKLILENGKSGNIYNISSANELDNITIAKKILSIMGKDNSLIEFVEDRPGHDVRYSLDSSKIIKELNWKPKKNFELAIKETVDWYLSNEWWWRPLADERTLNPTPWKLKW
jgi:dTDP-glucose 4,6-dehydratase